MVGLKKSVSYAAPLLMVLGCNVFDESLEQQIPGGTAGSSSGGSEPFLADACSGGLPTVGSAEDPVLYATSGLTNRRSEVGSCLIDSSVLQGADAFFEIKANAGDRWHFHLDGLVGQDLAVYVSSSGGCDDRLCKSSSDMCGPGRSEHFTFIPETAGSYVVGIDGIDPTLGDKLSLLAIRPVCGDDKKEHSEVCDDRNVTPGDGCDQYCRAELSRTTNVEVEPNDDSYGANILIPVGDSIAIRGTLGGTVCQPDVYLLDVPTTKQVTMTVLTASGNACTSAAPLSLEVIESDRGRLRGVALPMETVEAADGACPEWTGTLAAGSYFIRLSSLTIEPMETSYEFRVELAEP